MIRSDRTLPLIALTAAALGAAGWWVLRGPGAGEDDGIVRAEEPEEVEIARAEADLVAPEAPMVEERTEVVNSAELGPTDEVEADAAVAVEVFSVDGLLLLPQGFPAGGTASVRAWPDELRNENAVAAPIEITCDPSKTWTLEGLAEGRWIVSGRVEKDGRIAWGRAKPIEVVPDHDHELLRISTLEYVIEGVVTDSRGMPIPNLPVAYSWGGSDGYAGETTENRIFYSNGWISHGAFEPQTSGSLGEAEIQLLSNLQQDLTAIEDQLRAISSVSLDVVSFESASGDLPLYQDEELHNGGLVPAIASLPVGEFQFGSGVIVETEVEEPELIDVTAGASPTFDVQTWKNGVVETDASGRFRIALEGPGEVSIDAPEEGYEVTDGLPRWVTQNQDTASTAQSPRSSVSFSLHRAAAVAGRLARSDGNVDGDTLHTFLRPLGSGSTETGTAADDGSFRFDDLGAGWHLLYVRSGGKSGQDFSLHRRVFLKEGEEFRLDDILTPSASVTGMVTDDMGQPVAGVEVTAYGSENRGLSREGRTDESGRFQIVGMYACEYTFTVGRRELQNPVTMHVGAQAGYQNVGTLILAPATNK